MQSVFDLSRKPSNTLSLWLPGRLGPNLDQRGGLAQVHEAQTHHERGASEKTCAEISGMPGRGGPSIPHPPHSLPHSLVCSRFPPRPTPEVRPPVVFESSPSKSARKVTMAAPEGEPPTRCTYGPPPGIDALGLVEAGASGSSKDSFMPLRTDQDRPPGIWNEAKKTTTQLQGRLTLEVARLNRLLRELGGTLGELLMLRSQDLAHDFALDQAGAEDYGLLPLAAFILVSLDLIADHR